MSSITDLLAAILAAKKGEEVRGSIHDAIELCYQDGKAGVNDLQARQLIEAVAEVNEQQQAALEVLQARVEELENGEGGSSQQSTTIDIPTVLVDGGVVESLNVNNNGVTTHHITFTTAFTEAPRVMVAIGKNAGAVSQYGYLSANILYPTITTTGFDFFLANRTGSDRSPGVVWYAYQPTVRTIDLDITIPDAQGMSEADVRAITGPISAAVDAIKTGYDGTTYQTAAEAVRTQINDLHVLIGDEPGTAIDASAIGYGEDSNVADELTGLNERLVTVSENALARTKNLINSAEIKIGYIFNTTYSEYIANSNWVASDYIPVEVGKSYAFSYNNGAGYTMSHYYVLDAEKSYIGTATKSAQVITIPSELVNAAYLILETNGAVPKANVDTWMLEEGTEIADYIPYYIPIYKTAVVQTIGKNPDKIMSQKAILDSIDAVVATLEPYLIGNETYYDTAINSAISHLVENGGGVLNLPAKEMYIQNTIVIPSNVRIVGKGMGVTIIRLANGSDCDVVSVGNNSNCGISNLTIRGNRDRTSPAVNKCGLRVGLDGNENNVALSNNEIHDIVITGVSGNGLHCAKKTFVHILHDIHIKSCSAYGAYIGSIDSIFDSFYITSCGKNAVYINGSNLKLSNMKLIGSGFGSYLDDVLAAGLYNAGLRNCFVNIECQENRGHGFVFKDSTDIQIFNGLADANGMAYSDEETSEKTGTGFIFDNCKRINGSLMAVNYSGSKNDQARGMNINNRCSDFKLLYQKYNVYSGGEFDEPDVIDGTNISIL